MSILTSPITYLFLDTEWADIEGRELVSMALVSESGASTFYAERDPLPKYPTDFVARTVYPLLQRDHHALSDQKFADSLITYLRQQVSPHVVADYPNDLRLFREVISWRGCNSLDTEWGNGVPCTLMCRDAVTTAHLERWFSLNPQLSRSRHHALVDANGLRMAWLASTGRLSPMFQPLSEIPWRL